VGAYNRCGRGAEPAQPPVADATLEAAGNFVRRAAVQKGVCHRASTDTAACARWLRGRRPAGPAQLALRQWRCSADCEAARLQAWLRADLEQTMRRPGPPTRAARGAADEDLERARQGFVGAIRQRPPMFSALKVGGERLYAKARRGEVRRSACEPLRVKRRPSAALIIMPDLRPRP